MEKDFVDSCEKILDILNKASFKELSAKEVIIIGKNISIFALKLDEIKNKKEGKVGSNRK